jgi:hypothetical protein
MSTDSLVTIAGYSGSTKISPLQQAFETISLGVTLPGLKTDLLSTAALTSEHALALPQTLLNELFSTPYHWTRE